MQEEGIKFLYILDAYHGLFKLNLDTFNAQHLVSVKSAIELPSGAAAASAEAGPASSRLDSQRLLSVPRFFNDLDITEDGRVIYTDTSYEHTRSENRKDIMDAAPRGRLFVYDPRAGTVTVLMCGLHFPNGVQLLPPSNDGVVDNDWGRDGQRMTEVIVNELTRFRALRVNVDAAAVHEGRYVASCSERSPLWEVLMGQTVLPPSEVDADYATSGVRYFNEALPGLPDNVRADTLPAIDGEDESSNDSYFLFGLGSKNAQPFSLLCYAYQSIWLRDFVGKLVPMQWVEKLVPKYGLVVVTNSKGEIVDSLHDPSGVVHFISQADRNPITGDLWLGSHSEQLRILPARYVPLRWKVPHQS